MHTKENHIVYVYRGKATVLLNKELVEANQGQIVIVPAGMPHSIDIPDDSQVEIILISTPPANEEDTKLVE